MRQVYQSWWRVYREINAFSRFKYHTQGDSEELPPLTEVISDDNLSKKCHINLGSILSIYRVTFVFGFFLNFHFNVNYKMHLLSQKQINFFGLDCL
jgi:hypothetical protein